MIRPPPATFAEGQRQLALQLAAAAGICLGIGVAIIVFIMWRGGWSDASEAQRIGVISMIALGGLIGMVAVIVGLLLGGPVGRFKASAGKDGVSVEGEDDER